MSAFTFVIALVMAAGLLGTIVPILPGLLMVWAAALVYGLVEGFGTGGTIAFTAITVVAVTGAIGNFVVPTRAAAGAGAARSSIWVGVGLAIVGMFVVPVLGIAIGGTLGIYLGERRRGIEHDAAQRSTIATLKGMGLAMLVEFVAALICIITWIVWVNVA